MDTAELPPRQRLALHAGLSVGTPLRADLAAALAGIAAALALPPLFLTPFLVLAYAALLALIGAAPTALQAARRGFAFGLAHHLAGLYWVTNAVLVMAAQFWWAIPLAVPALAAALALFIALPCAAAWYLPRGLPRVLALPGLWVLGDLGRQFALTGFPWNPLGSVWIYPGAAGVFAAQPAALATVHGLTLATLLFAGLLTLRRRARIAAAGLALAWAAYAALRLAHPTPGALNLSAVIAQGNVPESEHRDHGGDFSWARSVFDRYLALTRAGIARAGDTPAIVVWPETASPFWLEQDPQARRALADAARPARAALVGTPREDAAHKPHNSLLAILPDGTIAAHYDKAHLVPFGEYFPSYLPLRLGEQGWVPGPGLVTLHVPGLPAIGPLICFEAAFPGQVAVETDRPAFLLNLTNDSWFGDSAGPRQHFAAARLRAIEEGLPVVRAANTGISAIIDGQGRVLDRLDLNREGVLVAAIPGALPPTLAARLGLSAPLGLSLLALAAGVLAGRRRTNSFLNV